MQTIGPVFRSRIFFALLTIVSAGAQILHGAPGGVVVQVVKSARIETPPGKVVTIGFSVENTSESRQRYTPQVILPAGWRTVLRPTAFELDAHASDFSLISLSIPADIPVGEYPVRYRVTDRSMPSHVADAAVTIAVRAVNRIELVMLESPRLLVAGENLNLLLSLSNKGNASASVRLQARSIGVDSVGFDSSVYHLRPNETHRVRAVGYSNTSLKTKIQTYLEITALFPHDSIVQASTAASVQIIPELSNVASNRFYFPVTATARMTGSRSAYGPQFEISGVGPLGDGSNDRLDFLFRAPETTGRSFLGTRDEYRAAYRSKAFDVYAGDQSYILSPLTEYGRFSFGGGGRATFAGATAGGFFTNNRFTPEKQTEAAGFLSYKFIEQFSLGVNYLQKKGADEGNIITFRSLAQPLEGTDLDLEYGTGNSATGNDNAYSVKLAGRTKRYTFSGWYVHAGPEYPGYFRDVNSAIGSFSVEAARWLRFEAYYRNERRNLQRDTARFIAPYDQYYHFGVSFSNYLSIYYEYTSQVDLLPASQYNNNERVIQVQTGTTLGPVGFLVYADVGQSENKLLDMRSLTQRYMFSTTAQLFGSQSYGVTLEYAKNRNLLTGDPQELKSAGLYVVAPIGMRTNFLISAYASESVSLTKQRFQTIDITVNHRFPWGHQLGIRGRENFFDVTGRRDYAYIMEYEVPLRIPIGRSGKAGELTGRIIDSETGKGLDRAVIYVGEATTIADDDGEYRFPIFAPDKYYIQVDKASIGFDRVTTVPMPLEVEIHGGVATRLDLGVVRSSSLKGSIVLYGFDTTKLAAVPPAYILLHPIYDIVVEITNGSEVYRRVTDRLGRFTFDDLRPGRWTLKVLEGQLPEYHNPEKDKYEFVFTPGKKQDVEVKVLPRRRAIRIIDEGKIIEAGKPVKTQPQVQPQPQAQTQVPIEIAPYYPIIWDEAKQGFVVRVSSWRTRRKAERDVRTIAGLTGMTPYINQTTVPGMGIRYRVNIGAFNTQEEAEAVVKILIEKRK